MLARQTLFWLSQSLAMGRISPHQCFPVLELSAAKRRNSRFKFRRNTTVPNPRKSILCLAVSSNDIDRSYSRREQFTDLHHYLAYPRKNLKRFPEIHKWLIGAEARKLSRTFQTYQITGKSRDNQGVLITHMQLRLHFASLDPPKQELRSGFCQPSCRSYRPDARNEAAKSFANIALLHP
jgi:hypothetical protein